MYLFLVYFLCYLNVDRVELVLITQVFYIVLLCHQATAPFLHIGALATVTAVSWLIAGYVIRRERSSKCWPVVQVKVPVITRTDLRFRFLWLTQSGEGRRRAFLYDVQAQHYLYLINQLSYTYSYQHVDIFDISNVVWCVQFIFKCFLVFVWIFQY